jgi:hypothetical protein
MHNDNNKNENEQVDLIAYTGDDATAAGSRRGAIRQTAKAVQSWAELATVAAQRAQWAASQGLDLAARIESQIVEICTYEALKAARNGKAG